MLIPPENRARYPGGSPTSAEWRAIRARILERAGDRCEHCGAPDGKLVTRGKVLRPEGDVPVYITPGGIVRYADSGKLCWRRPVLTGRERPEIVMIVLTITHVDHGLDDHSDSNLLALCQRCHLQHDAKQRAANAAATRRARKARAEQGRRKA